METFETMHHAFYKAAPGRTYFRTTGDFARFEELLADGRKLFGIALYAYSLMPNHWHLIIKARRREDLKAFLRWLTFRSAVGRRPSYELYATRAINGAEHFYRTCRYVERNALTADLVPAAEDWRWSSIWVRMRAPAAYSSLLLDPWPEGLPPDWLRTVNLPFSQLEHDYTRRRSKAIDSPSVSERP